MVPTFCRDNVVDINADTSVDINVEMSVDISVNIVGSNVDMYGYQGGY
jgi:hypothetical protein